MPRSGGPMAPGARPLWLLALWTLAGPARSGAAEAGDGGWQRRGPGAPAAVPEEERCAVERRSDLSYSEFVQHYAFSRPVVLQGLTDNSRFRALCSRERLLASFGERVVRLSTANTYSYRKVDLPFREYVEHLLHPQDPTALGNANGRHFFSTTPHPRLVCWAPPLRTASALQRWFLYPPAKTPEFHPNRTTLAWLRDVYPALAPSTRPLECTVRAGEVLYFPDRWWHATLNLDPSVFISTFLS
ncbi:jmjC domain-containing protein 8 isoform X3 [Hyaena hyaena]|uniref:jmjC domain-containing protein 8 isoform X3 n=1 Tax=Hyaena hyaena TaxID=95912 RepID=UPI0019251583|nr:jmjC domain-containing protein 8 isoform X3 [Hyaena hyaena]